MGEEGTQNLLVPAECDNSNKSLWTVNNHSGFMTIFCGTFIKVYLYQTLKFHLSVFPVPKKKRDKNIQVLYPHPCTYVIQHI